MEEKTAVAPELNRLYWESGQSVAEISNHLGVSRRALYEMIEPLPAGVECSSCGAELHFVNRSTKAAGVARCLVCGKEQELGTAADDDTTIPPYSAGFPAVTHAANGMRDRAVAIASFALAGVVVGAIATLLVRRRH